MTYCVAASVDAGLVFVSEAPKNAGIDQLTGYAKMHTFGTMSEVADSVGEISLEQQDKHRNRTGNQQSSLQTPLLQIGETKSGKSILDRVTQANVSLQAVACCGLANLDSTTRSNVNVGSPIEVLQYPADSLRQVMPPASK